MIFNLPFDYQLIQTPSIDKYKIQTVELKNILYVLKHNPEFEFKRLNSIVAIDLENEFELIYNLHSLILNEFLNISVTINHSNPHIPSVVNIFKSAYFDECEIFDMFGIHFDGNIKLKRLLMPKGWVGYPLRKDYVLEDKRLDWSRVDG